MFTSYFWAILAYILAASYTAIMFHHFSSKSSKGVKVGIGHIIVFVLWPICWIWTFYTTVQDIRRTRENINRIKKDLTKQNKN